MNTYGKTECPNCQSENSLFRPIKELTPIWDNVDCYKCGHNYKHSEIINELDKAFNICDKARNFK